MSDVGKLYIVATPIGNLADISQRAIDTLAQVRLIAAEDTRHAQKLLNHYSIGTATVSCHEHNEESRFSQIKELLDQGQDVALISDAGTPLISDPGYKLVSLLRTEGYQVSAVPGACAFIAALSISGLATDSFGFYGFLPAKSGQRQARLTQFMAKPETLVFYESTHRIIKCLEDIAQVDIERKVVIARELTKTFETLISATALEIVEMMQQDHNQQKGEFVVMVQGAESQETELSEQDKRWLMALLDVMPVSKASQLVAKVTGLKKKQVYDLAEQLKS